MVCVYIYIYTQCSVTQSLKKKNAICSNMDGPTDCPTEWNKSEGEIPYDIPFICGI